MNDYVEFTYTMLDGPFVTVVAEMRENMFLQAAVSHHKTGRKISWSDISEYDRQSIAAKAIDRWFIMDKNDEKMRNAKFAGEFNDDETEEET